MMSAAVAPERSGMRNGKWASVERVVAAAASVATNALRQRRVEATTGVDGRPSAGRAGGHEGCDLESGLGCDLGIGKLG
jgi:hypothetical protein